MFFRAPHSYTGEDVVELRHDGSAVARRLVEAWPAAALVRSLPLPASTPPRVPERQAGSDAGRSGDGSDLGGWPPGAALANAALGGALAKISAP